MQLLPLGRQQFFDSNGNVLDGGSVCFFAPGTMNPLATWADSQGSVENPNPVVLDAAGTAVIWGNTAYRQVVKDSTGATIWDEVVNASVASTDLNAAEGAAVVGFIQAGSNTSVRDVLLKARERVSIDDFQVYPDDDPNDTTQKIQQILQELSSSGGSSKELVFLKTSDAYCINSPIILRRGVSLVGPGGKNATIKNVTTSYDFFYSSVILPGNFHPEYIQAMETNAIEPTVAGSSVVNLVDSSDASKYSIGMQVVIQSSAGYSSGEFKIPQFLYLNEVVDISSGAITLKYSLDRSFVGVMTGLDGTQLGRNGVPLFFWQDAALRNLNLITSGYIHSDTATLNCQFTDLYYRGRSAIYGNAFQKTHWERIQGQVGTVGEMSLSSLDCTIKDFDFRYDPTLATPTGTAILGFQENSRDIRVMGGKIDTGSYVTGAPFLNFLNTENVQVDGLIGLAGSGFTGAAVQFSGVVLSGKIACKNNEVRNVRFDSEDIARYYLISGDATVGASLNNTLRDSLFYGTPSSGECGRVVMSRDRHVIAGNYFEAGKPLFDSSSIACEFVDNFVGGGFSTNIDPDIYTRNLIRSNSTPNTQARLTLNRYLTSAVTQDGISPLFLINAPVGQSLFPRDTIEFQIRGYITGAAASKCLKIYFLDNTTETEIDLGTLTFDASTTGAFYIQGNIYVALLNSIVCDIQLIYPGAVAPTLIDEVSTTDITGMDLSFVIESVCSNASDSISYRKIKASLTNPLLL